MPTPSRRARINLVADFETTTDPDETHVWMWGGVNVETPNYDDVIVGTDIDSFIEYCQRRNANIYFHNLRFDGNFILYWLLTHGYEHTTSKYKTLPGEFKTLIDGRGTWFSVTVVWKNGKTTEFRDSFKKLPMQLARVATSFGLEVTKGEIDYEKPREVGYQPTAEEIDYQIRDVVVIAQALATQFSEGMTKLTVASDAMTEFKSVFGAERFKRVFPVLPEQLDTELRQAYRGGWTYADERTRGNTVQCGGVVFDVNSLYPSVMYNALLPYGEPVYFSGHFTETERYPLGIFSVTFTAKIKKNHVPCIQIKGQAFFTNTEYLSKITQPTTLWVTSVDWELWNKHYDIEVQSYNGGYAFKAAQGFFDDYIDKWSRIKANSVGGLREIAKLMLNSLYGKFASNPRVTSKNPRLKDGHVAFELGSEETRAPVYTAMGAFITAYARQVTITAAQANYSTFAYADTDSIHLLIPTPEWVNKDNWHTWPGRHAVKAIEIHSSNLGAWKLEMVFADAMYVRSKFYLERNFDGTYENHVAGLPAHAAEVLDYSDIWQNHELNRTWYRDKTGEARAAKLRPQSIPGGIVLKDTPFTVKL